MIVLHDRVHWSSFNWRRLMFRRLFFRKEKQTERRSLTLTFYLETFISIESILFSGKRLFHLFFLNKKHLSRKSHSNFFSLENKNYVFLIGNVGRNNIANSFFRFEKRGFGWIFCHLIVLLPLEPYCKFDIERNS